MRLRARQVADALLGAFLRIGTEVINDVWDKAAHAIRTTSAGGQQGAPDECLSIYMTIRNPTREILQQVNAVAYVTETVDGGQPRGVVVPWSSTGQGQYTAAVTFELVSAAIAQHSAFKWITIRVSPTKRIFCRAKDVYYFISVTDPQVAPAKTRFRWSGGEETYQVTLASWKAAVAGTCGPAPVAVGHGDTPGADRGRQAMAGRAMRVGGVGEHLANQLVGRVILSGEGAPVFVMMVDPDLVETIDRAQDGYVAITMKDGKQWSVKASALVDQPWLLAVEAEEAPTTLPPHVAQQR